MFFFAQKKSKLNQFFKDDVMESQKLHDKLTLSF